MNSNSHINHGEAVYIIKPQARYTLKRDEIQGRLAALDDIHDCVVMIYQACGNTPKLGKLASGNPYCSLDKKRNFW